MRAAGAGDMAGLDDLLADLFAPMGDITLRLTFGGIGPGMGDFARQAFGGQTTGFDDRVEAQPFGVDDVLDEPG